MIISEPYETGFIRTYSDAGVKIECDGHLYDEAVDLVGSGNTYTETDIPVYIDEEEGGE